MKYTHNKYLILSSCLFSLATAATHAVADLNSDAEIILNAAAGIFGASEPPDTTHSINFENADWLYRQYRNNILVGIKIQQQEVWWYQDGKLNLFKNVADTLSFLNPQQSDSSGGDACDVAKLPAGISYSQEGNHVKITSNGNCLALPKTSICVPPKPTATGISVLSQNEVKTFTLEGIQWADPQLEVAFTPMIKDAINAKTCLINAPQSYAEQIVETDLCFNVTNELNELSALQGLLTITPPVNMRMLSNVANSTVADCFATDALIITDAFNNKSWVKENGNFVEVPQ